MLRSRHRPFSMLLESPSSRRPALLSSSPVSIAWRTGASCVKPCRDDLLPDYRPVAFLRSCMASTSCTVPAAGFSKRTFMPASSARAGGHALVPGNTRGNHAEVSAAFACVKHGAVVAAERASERSETRTRRSSDPDPRGARSRLDLAPDFHNTYTVGRFCGRYLSSRGLHA